MKAKKNIVIRIIAILLMMTNTFFYQEYHQTDPTNTMFMLAIVCTLILMISTFLSKKIIFEKTRRITIILLVPLLIEIAVEYCNHNLLADIEGIGNVLINYGIILIVIAILYACTSRLKISVVISAVLLCLFGVANMYVKQFKGIPLLPWDITVIRTAAGVASNYRLTFNVQIAFTLTIFIFILMLVSFLPVKEKTPRRWMTRAACIIIPGAILITFYKTNFFQTTIGATPDFFNQTRGYENYGAIAEFIANTKYLSLSKPDGYRHDRIREQLLAGIENQTSVTEYTLHQKPAAVENPNIIVIMNEAFSDLQVIGSFSTDKDYMPFENRMKNAENTIQGNVYVSTIGTGTSNTEYEFLTGNSMAFLPIGSNAYTLYEKHTQPGLTMNLAAQGYSTTAFHPYYKENWNRVDTYRYMGFERYIGLEDISHYRKLRNYISDEWDFEYITQLYEQRDTSKPFFLFNVTMQNHSPYNTGLLHDVEITSMKGDYPETEEYLSAILRSDIALEQLVNYFQNVSEPTLILMFGDHQPFIEDRFYEELFTKELADLSDAENQRRYITHFFMWANYDIPEGQIDQISANYLQLLLAENANLSLTPYQKYLQNRFQNIPVITALGCIDHEGQYFIYGDHNQYHDELNIYDRITYNNLIEDACRINDLFAFDEK